MKPYTNARFFHRANVNIMLPLVHVYIYTALLCIFFNFAFTYELNSTSIPAPGGSVWIPSLRPNLRPKALDVLHLARMWLAKCHIGILLLVKANYFSLLCRLCSGPWALWHIDWEHLQSLGTKFKTKFKTKSTTFGKPVIYKMSHSPLLSVEANDLSTVLFYFLPHAVSLWTVYLSLW